MVADEAEEGVGSVAGLLVEIDDVDEEEVMTTDVVVEEEEDPAPKRDPLVYNERR